MTAVIIATFVERGTLTWETTLGDVFRELATAFPSDFRADHGNAVAHSLRGITGKPRLAGNRSNALRLTRTAPRRARASGGDDAVIATGNEVGVPESRLRLAGAIAERVGGKPWEELMREIVFTPLGMTTLRIWRPRNARHDRSAVAAHRERSADVVEWSGHRQCRCARSGRDGPLLHRRLVEVHRRSIARRTRRTRPPQNGHVQGTAHASIRSGPMHSVGASPHECGAVERYSSTVAVTR